MAKGNLWVVKLDAGGSILWDKTYNDYNPEPDYYFVYGAQAVQPTYDGGFVMNVLIIGSDPYDSPVWIVKADADGNFEWDNFVGSETQIPKTSTIIQTHDSGYLVGYTAFGHADEELSYTIARLDKNGTTKWGKSFDGSDYSTSVLKSLVELGNGNFILGGYSNSDI